MISRSALKGMSPDEMHDAIRERTEEITQLKRQVEKQWIGKSFMCRNGKHDKRIVGVVIRKDGHPRCRGCEQDRDRRYYLKKKEAYAS